MKHPDVDSLSKKTRLIHVTQPPLVCIKPPDMDSAPGWYVLLVDHSNNAPRQDSGHQVMGCLHEPAVIMASWLVPAGVKVYHCTLHLGYQLVAGVNMEHLRATGYSGRWFSPGG